MASVTNAPIAGASTASVVAALIARARAAQRVYGEYDQSRLDETVAAAGWAIIEPGRNRTLAEVAVRDTGLGNVADKIVKNHRKTLGLLRDLKGARSTGVIAEYPERGIVEIAKPAGVVAAIVPSTNPGATPANNIISAATPPSSGRRPRVIRRAPSCSNTSMTNSAASACRPTWCRCCRPP